MASLEENRTANLDPIKKHKEKLQKVLMELKITEAHASEETKRKLIAVIDENLDAFAENDDDLGKTDLVEHRIITDGSPAIRLKARQIPYAAREWADQELDRMEKLGIISFADAGICPYAMRMNARASTCCN